MPCSHRILPILTSSPQAPEIVSLYSLSVSPQYVRDAIRRRFEDSRYVTDLRVIDQLYLKGRQEYQETMNFWKQKEHVMGKLLLPRERPQRTFLQKFYEGVWKHMWHRPGLLKTLHALQGGTRTKFYQLLPDSLTTCLSTVFHIRPTNYRTSHILFLLFCFWLPRR